MIRLKWRKRGLIRTGFSAWYSAGPDLQAVISGPIGKLNLTAAGRDLVRVGLAVFAIERSLPGASSGNRPVEIEATLHLEQPGKWTRHAIDSLRELLAFQGDATWNWTMRGGASPRSGIECRTLPDEREVERIVLFSGGLDSTSGIASARASAPSSQLVSHYSRQKALQLEIASQLEYSPPTQVRTVGATGRGRGFLYRSFYYLCLSAAVASTYGTRRVVQYENGVLAAAIPPAPAYFMTRHAHPFVHRAAEQLFSDVLGGEWAIENPFLKLTKRECFEGMAASLGLKPATLVARRTETCWYQHSNQYLGGKKKENGIACGVCIPCIIRRTAMRTHSGAFDLNRRAIRSDSLLARDFNAYRLFAERALDQGKRMRLMLEMPSYVRGLTRGEPPPLSRVELTDMVERFAREFSDVFA